MLKFLDLVLRDIKETSPEMQYFFLSLLEAFADYISYNLYDEVFSVFDRLLNLCADVLSENVLKKCILALVDKYTMKSKAHK